jgi:glycosyltransferase involved in cell wall biosynthesis
VTARKTAGLDDRTVFLFLFDHLSTIGRKNPLGTIEAYREAFTEADGAVLVMKSINAVRSPDTYEQVRAAASGRSDILLVDTFLSRGEANALLGMCDVYVSLHRSEGLGFTMAEAMLLGRPVIASAYGGNLDFMDEASAVLIPTTSGHADRDYPPYLAGSVWADPDLDVAAHAMRRLANDEDERRRLGDAAAAHAAAYFDPRRCTQIVIDRLATIRSASGLGSGGAR